VDVGGAGMASREATETIDNHPASVVNWRGDGNEGSNGREKYIYSLPLPGRFQGDQLVHEIVSCYTEAVQDM
jgi:hypothetical protein